METHLFVPRSEVGLEQELDPLDLEQLQVEEELVLLGRLDLRQPVCLRYCRPPATGAL